jgi:hypothetical protein
VRALRGRGNSAKAKWQDQGWEFVSENRGPLRTELNFRRVKPKTFGAHLVSIVAAFGRMRPKTRLVLVTSCALILVAGIVGIVVGTHSGGDTLNPSAAQAEAARQATRRTPTAGTVAAAPPIGPPAATGTALAALNRLTVKGRAPKTGYIRERYGDGWTDSDGCDTRDRILTRDLTHKSYLDGCRVKSGTLADPYTAAAIQFARGGASEVDIDHVVPLSDAWQKGAQQWSPSTRVAFANDPLNLLAVDAHTNRSKGDGDAATWLPPNKPFRCAYVARQVAVKRKYHAWVTTAERDAIRRVLASCPGEPLPKPGARIHIAATHIQPTPTPSPKPTGTGRSRGSGSSGAGHLYANCTAVRAAGKAPLYRGTPDYAANSQMDRDHDGVACE